MPGHRPDARRPAGGPPGLASSRRDEPADPAARPSDRAAAADSAAGKPSRVPDPLRPSEDPEVAGRVLGPHRDRPEQRGHEPGRVADAGVHRSFDRPRVLAGDRDWLLTAGVENIGDKLYREHLDPMVALMLCGFSPHELLLRRAGDVLTKWQARSACRPRLLSFVNFCHGCGACLLPPHFCRTLVGARLHRPLAAGLFPPLTFAMIIGDAAAIPPAPQPPMPLGIGRSTSNSTAPAHTRTNTHAPPPPAGRPHVLQLEDRTTPTVRLTLDAAGLTLSESARRPRTRRPSRGPPPGLCSTAGRVSRQFHRLRQAPRQRRRQPGEFHVGERHPRGRHEGDGEHRRRRGHHRLRGRRPSAGAVSITGTALGTSSSNNITAASLAADNSTLITVNAGRPVTTTARRPRPQPPPVSSPSAGRYRPPAVR